MYVSFLTQIRVVGDRLVVTDMLTAMLNICTQEELMEGSDGSAGASPAPVDRDLPKRRKVIQNKIIAVGCMLHFFSLLRYAPLVVH